MSIESDWIDGKAEAKADLEAALGIGMPLEMAKRVSRWNPTYEYATFDDMQTVGLSAKLGPREALQLLYSRSAGRVNSGTLEGAVLDAGKLYAIFIPDVPELNILDISFELNGSPIHHEYSTPWDYAGTAGGGEANRLTFVAGSYTIEAIVNETGGPYSFDASFTVE